MNYKYYKVIVNENGTFVSDNESVVNQVTNTCQVVFYGVKEITDLHKSDFELPKYKCSVSIEFSITYKNNDRTVVTLFKPKSIIEVYDYFGNHWILHYKNHRVEIPSEYLKIESNESIVTTAKTAITNMVKIPERFNLNWIDKSNKSHSDTFTLDNLESIASWNFENFLSWNDIPSKLIYESVKNKLTKSE